VRRAILVLAALALVVPAGASGQAGTKKLRKAVTVDGIMAHERAFQQIANQTGGTRAAHTPGYDASVDYVARRLRRAGYQVRLREFDFPNYQVLGPSTFQQLTPTDKTYVEDTDYLTPEFSGGGTVEAEIVPTSDIVIPDPGGPGASTSGCEASDFPAETAGNIALIQRGTCFFTDKVANAEAAGAAAVVIFNDGFPERTEPVLFTAPEFTGIPVLSASSAVGQELVTAAQGGTVTARVVVNATTTPGTQVNVLGNSRTGDPDRVIVVGGHLDSVREGPGINDNGSGTSSILEIAEQISELGKEPRNRLRFAFWGAEEAGLVGSSEYVAQLTPAQISRIAMNLNFDMVGSPNFVRFVYDGDTSDTEPPEGGAPPGSGRIEAEFVDFWESQGLQSEPTPFDGRSDYGPFIAQGIPAGGLFSGAEQLKTPEEVAIYGGVAGEQYDPCYHEECDTIQNLSPVALSQFSDAAAHATWHFARAKSPLVNAAKAKVARSAKSRAKRRNGFDFRGAVAIR
jgi:Zn-dependent M28 family amino/carboxypeptidase